jgi:hypothetical protein
LSETNKEFLIKGKITVNRDSKDKRIGAMQGIGVSDLLVVAYDVSPEFDPSSIFSILTGTNNTNTNEQHLLNNIKNGSRIGSVLSNNEGEFEIRYDPKDFSEGNEKNPDLLLFVFSPEDCIREQDTKKINIKSELLYCSNFVRKKVKHMENYYIRIEESSLKRLNIPYRKS